MLDWIGHQLAVWRYGALVLMMLAVMALASAVAGSILAVLVTWLTDQAFTGTLWFICSIAVAPFYLPNLARHIADMVRSDPPPRSGDLFRKRMRKGKV
jgi:hypothetical protein